MKKLIIFLVIFASFISIANAQWQQVTNPPGLAGYYCMASNGSDLFVGSYGVSLSTDNGATWTAINNGFPSIGGYYPYPGVYSIAMSGSNIFAGTGFFGPSGIFLSSNNGANWTAVNNGLPLIGGTYPFISEIAISGSDIFAGVGTIGIFLSSNNGASWTAVNNGLPLIGGSYPYISEIAISGSNIFAGTNNSGIFLSTNNGASWTAVNNGLPSNCWITSIVISGSNIFAGTNNSGIFLSSNNGASWTAVNNGLPLNCRISSMVINGSNIFATADHYLFLSSNNGASWTSISTNFPATALYNPSLTICGSDLFIINDTTQIWKRPLSDFCTADAGPDVYLCSGQSATLTATGGVAYLWSSGETTSSITVSPPVTAAYTVTVVTLNGCTASDEVIVNTNLDANFNYYITDTIGHIYQFNNYTSGTNLSYNWDFGDNTTSTVQNPLHIFPNTGYYNVCLTITKDSCMAQFCQIVHVVNPISSGCQANFYSTLLPDGETFQFINTSTFIPGNYQTTWTWDFGDGNDTTISTYTQLINMTHVFADTGTYNVCLNIANVYWVLGGTDTCFSQYCNVVHFNNYPDSLKYTVKGAVHADSTPTTSAIVILFNTDYGYFNAVDYQIVDTIGAFQFDSVITGNYILWAIPDFSLYPNYLPTYYGDVLYWQNAYVVYVNANTYSLDIHLVPLDSAAGHLKTTDNTGSISGNITFESNLTYEENIFGQDWFGNKGGDGSKTAIAGRNIPIFIKDSNGDVKNWALADENGHFNITNLPLQNYTVNAEKASLLSVSPVIPLTNSIPAANVTISIGVNNIVTSVENQLSFEILNGLSFYPNPVTDNLNIKFNLEKQADVEVAILNITGQVVKTMQYELSKGSNTSSFDLSELSSGLYFGRINVNGINTANFKFIK